ncbi:hypothetical protein AA11237_2217 [Acidocella aminolytica 101 = DSM 11237]|nr:hypothetical protein AA11237_2217 [Acidocella aminolytica 101 = DSM 11237]
MDFVTFVLDGLDHGLSWDCLRIATDFDNALIEIDRDIRAGNNFLNGLSHGPDTVATCHAGDFKFEHH